MRPSLGLCSKWVPHLLSQFQNTLSLHILSACKMFFGFTDLAHLEVSHMQQTLLKYVLRGGTQQFPPRVLFE